MRKEKRKMALIYTRKNKADEDIRLGYYAGRNEYVIYVGKRIYGKAYNIGDAYRLYNEVK